MSSGLTKQLGIARIAEMHRRGVDGHRANQGRTTAHPRFGRRLLPRLTIALRSTERLV